MLAALCWLRCFCSSGCAVSRRGELQDQGIVLHDPGPLPLLWYGVLRTEAMTGVLGFKALLFTLRPRRPELWQGRCGVLGMQGERSRISVHTLTVTAPFAEDQRSQAPSTPNDAQPPWQRGCSFNVSCLVLVADILAALFSRDVPSPWCSEPVSRVGNAIELTAGKPRVFFRRLDRASDRSVRTKR